MEYMEIMIVEADGRLYAVLYSKVSMEGVLAAEVSRGEAECLLERGLVVGVYSGFVDDHTLYFDVNSYMAGRGYITVTKTAYITDRRMLKYSLSTEAAECIGRGHG